MSSKLTAAHPADGTLVDSPKVRIGFRLAPDVVRSIRATGRGYNARIERLLREASAEGKL